MQNGMLLVFHLVKKKLTKPTVEKGKSIKFGEVFLFFALLVLFGRSRMGNALFLEDLAVLSVSVCLRVAVVRLDLIT